MKLIIDDARKNLAPTPDDLTAAFATPKLEFIELVRDDEQRLRAWHHLRADTWELFHSQKSVQVWRDSTEEFDIAHTRQRFHDFMANREDWDAGIDWRSPQSLFTGKTFLKLAMWMGLFFIMLRTMQFVVDLIARWRTGS